MIGSDWGWHSFKPPTAAHTGGPGDPFAAPGPGTFWDAWHVSSNRTSARTSWYPTCSWAAANPSPALDAALSWRGQNPHRISLGQIALRRLDKLGKTASIAPADIAAINQTLDLWSGLARSAYNLGDDAVVVKTVVHGKADLVSAQVDSGLVAAGRLGIAVSFGGGSSGKAGANWSAEGDHTSEVVAAASTPTSVLILRTQDHDSYSVRVSFAPGFELRRVGPHAFVVAPPLSLTSPSPASLWVSVSFAPTKGYGIERFLPATLNRTTAVGACTLDLSLSLTISFAFPGGVPPLTLWIRWSLRSDATAVPPLQGFRHAGGSPRAWRLRVRSCRTLWRQRRPARSGGTRTGPAAAWWTSPPGSRPTRGRRSSSGGWCCRCIYRAPRRPGSSSPRSLG